MIQILSLFQIVSRLIVDVRVILHHPHHCCGKRSFNQSNLECVGESGAGLRRKCAAKLAAYIGQEVLDKIFLPGFVSYLIRSTINPVGPNLAVKRK